MLRSFGSHKNVTIGQKLVLGIPYIKYGISSLLSLTALHDFLGHDNDNNNYQLRNGVISLGDLVKEIRHFYNMVFHRNFNNSNDNNGSVML